MAPVCFQSIGWGWYVHHHPRRALTEHVAHLIKEERLESSPLLGQHEREGLQAWQLQERVKACK